MTKREGLIHKFYLDESGTLSARKQEKSNKVRITSFPADRSDKGSNLVTLVSREEIIEALNTSWASE